MHFKYPEILYALFLLVIPILVHLFQLRRFKKTWFTNVQFLKNIEIQTRKSSQIKKWLLLTTRLLLLASIIIAFAQPYFDAIDKNLQNNQLYLVVDNSFSMQAKGAKGELLKNTIQEIIENTPENQTINLVTNDNFILDTDVKTIKNELIKLKHSYQVFDPNIQLKKIEAKSPNTPKDIVFLTDANGKFDKINLEENKNNTYYFYAINAESKSNIAINGVEISEVLDQFYELKIQLKLYGELYNDLPISLYNNNKLVAKTIVKKDDFKDFIYFNIPKNEFNGYVTLNDNSLTYDNNFYFSISKPKKSNVLAIGNAETNSFLSKIYTIDEFNFSSSDLKSTAYSNIENQNAIILNELENIPTALTSTLFNYYKKGGTIIFIPSENGDLISYNNFFKNFNTNLNGITSEEKQLISNIQFNHPLYRNVFEKTVKNFQYPFVKKINQIKGNILPILKLQNQQVFLGEITNRIGSLYVFNSAINKNNSNFQQSPLIVPTFYNMGQNKNINGLQAFTIGENQSLIIENVTIADENVEIKNTTESFIPLQQKFSDKLKLSFSEAPYTSGNYNIYKEKDLIKPISFNYNRTESNILAKNESAFDDCTPISSLSTFFSDIHANRSDNTIWKIFIFAGLIFMIIELLIQRLIK